MPLLKVEGYADIEGKNINLIDAFAYHDHNWGRWHWGEDIGWEWGCFVTDNGQNSFVFARTTDRFHQQFGAPWCSVHSGKKTRRFPVVSINCAMIDGQDRTIIRLPGALAALHQDRRWLRLPETVRLRARDGIDHIDIIFRARAAAQLITADPIRPGYGFIHELPGRFEITGHLGGRQVHEKGQGIFEYVT